MCSTHGNVSTLMAAITVLLTAIYIYENERNMLRLKEEFNLIAEGGRNDMSELRKTVNGAKDEFLKFKKDIRRILQEANISNQMKMKIIEDTKLQHHVSNRRKQPRQPVCDMYKTSQSPIEDAGIDIFMTYISEIFLVIALLAVIFLFKKVQKLTKPGPAFSAVFESLSPPKRHDDDYNLKFDKIYLNRGNGYNPSSGDFTAPLSGIYLVASTFRSSDVHDILPRCYIYHNSEIVGLIECSEREAESFQMVRHFAKGDTLCVHYDCLPNKGNGDSLLFNIVCIS